MTKNDLFPRLLLAAAIVVLVDASIFAQQPPPIETAGYIQVSVSTSVKTAAGTVEFHAENETFTIGEATLDRFNKALSKGSPIEVPPDVQSALKNAREEIVAKGDTAKVAKFDELFGQLSAMQWERQVYQINKTLLFLEPPPERPLVLLFDDKGVLRIVAVLGRHLPARPVDPTTAGRSVSQARERVAVIDLRVVASESMEGKAGLAKLQELAKKRASKDVIQRAQSELQLAFTEKAGPIIIEVASEQGYRVVVATPDGIVWRASQADLDEVDITKEVTRRLDLLRTAAGPALPKAASEPGQSKNEGDSDG